VPFLIRALQFKAATGRHRGSQQLVAEHLQEAQLHAINEATPQGGTIELIQVFLSNEINLASAVSK